MKKKIFKKDVVIYLVMLVFTVLIFMPWAKNHFATDTYKIADIGYFTCAKYSTVDGRIIMAIIGTAAGILNMPITLYVSILGVLALITSCFTVIFLKNIVVKYKDNIKLWQEIIITIICYYTLFNFSYFENMYFAECFVMALSVLFYTIAANIIVNISKKQDYIKVLLFIILGLICYQGTISALFIMVVLLSILKDDGISIIKNLIISGIAFAIGVIINSGCIMFFEKAFNTVQTRGISISVIPQNIVFILKNCTKVLVNTAYIFPQYLYILFVVWLLGISFIKLFNSENKKNIILILDIIILIFFGMGCAFIPSVANLTGFWAARMRFSLGALIGTIFIYLIIKTDVLNGKKIYDKIIITFIIIYGLINSINYVYLINSVNETNRLDKIYSKQIDEYITQYEEENGIKVEKIGVVVIQNKTYKAYYSQGYGTGSITTVSAISTEWSLPGVINYYSDRKLIEKEITKEEYDYFIENVDEALGFLCKDDTLYIAAYMY